MLQRFTGESGRRLRVQALLSQKLIAGNLELAEKLSDSAKFFELSKGQTLIEQNAAENDVYMIITGSFDVLINGRKIARRFPNDHVGEMAAIELTQQRSASVIASEQSVVAQISEAEFSALGSQFPEIYLAVARELSRRLHQRNAHVAAARERTKVFIISSVESLEVARIVQNSFAHDNFLPVLWTDGVFRVASYPMQSLIDEVTDSDFAIAIAHGDDTSSIRGKEWPVPRDNVIFELGLFMGHLGKDRAILMEPRDDGVKLPSDMTGITTIPYRYQVGRDGVAMMAPACNVLREHILRLGPNV
jgi:predicted nucleotide-binding protein